LLNGLHDAANSIATVVSTRVLRPQYAVVWAAFFNFIAFLFFGLHVAQTVGTGIVAADVVDAAVIFGALMGAICWNLITWWLGMPSSSSHALIGGLAGAAVTKAGLGSIVWSGLGITAAAIVFSPLLGFFLALLLVLTVSWAFVRTSPSAVDNTFRSLQFIDVLRYPRLYDPYDHRRHRRRRRRPQDRCRALERGQRRGPGLDRDAACGGVVRRRFLRALQISFLTCLRGVTLPAVILA
jgi:phosphate/sulfate permease